MDNSDYLPGCYANLPLALGESLPGYLLRLAEANGYSGIRGLLSALRGPSTLGVGPDIRALRASETLLADLGRMSVGDKTHCMRFWGQHAGEHAAIYEGNRVDHDAWLEPHAQLCPLCLSENAVIPEEWDLSPVTACEHHLVQLRDACATCGEPITWNRPSLLHCPSCGDDYRGQAALPATESNATVSGDFAAMAGFRYKTHERNTQVGTWSMGFEVFKVLCLNASHWASRMFPSSLVRKLGIAERVAVSEQLARSRVNHVYELPRLAPHISDLLKPLRIFPRTQVLERFARDFVVAQGVLTPDIVEAMTSSEPIPVPVPGHALFAGRPPAIRGAEAAANFLGVDNLTYAGLHLRGALSKPSGDEPYDIDELLSAQRFLAEELLTMAEQQAIIGVPLLLEPGPQEAILISWNRYNQADRRIPLQTFLPIHLHLLARWQPDIRLDQPVSLKDLAGQTEHPIAALARAINLIVSGAISRFAWQAPYRWADVQVEHCESEQVFRGAKMKSS